MRSFLPALLVFALSAGSLLADDQVKDVQTQLKAQGFYFGEVDGVAGKDFSAAIRRFQIRNGLDVTGDVNPQVLQSLGIGGAPPAVAANPPPQVAPEPAPETVAPPAAAPAPHSARGPADLRRDESVAESDRRALQQEPTPRPQGGFVPPSTRPGQPPAGQPPEDPSVQPSAQYRDIFAGTPYANAPRPVQEETFLRAERLLSSRGLLPRRAVAAPSGDVEGALLAYQRGARLPPTGRLDLETLNAMHLLPGRGEGNPGVAPLRPGEVPRPKAYRGIWVQ